MNYILKNNFGASRGKHPRKKVVILSAIAAVFAAGFYFWSGWFCAAALSLSVPFMQIYNRIAGSVGSGAGGFQPKMKLIQENEAMKEQIAQLQREKLSGEARISELAIFGAREDIGGRTN